MPHPAALTARMNTNMAASRPRSRGVSSVRTLCQRDLGPADVGPADVGPADVGPADVGPDDVEPDLSTGPVIDRTALQPRTRVRRQASQATGLIPRGGFTVAGQCRICTGLRWTGCHPGGPGRWPPYKRPQ